jgi:hypothetical protein
MKLNLKPNLTVLQKRFQLIEESVSVPSPDATSFILMSYEKISEQFANCREKKTLEADLRLLRICLQTKEELDGMFGTEGYKQKREELLTQFAYLKDKILCFSAEVSYL